MDTYVLQWESWWVPLAALIIDADLAYNTLIKVVYNHMA